MIVYPKEAVQTERFYLERQKSARFVGTARSVGRAGKIRKGELKLLCPVRRPLCDGPEHGQCQGLYKAPLGAF